MTPLLSTASIFSFKTRSFLFIAIFYGFFVCSGCGSSAALGSVSSTSSEVDESEASLTETFDAGLNASGPVWIPQRYNITCCLGGTPEIADGRFARNLSSNVLEYIIDEAGDDASANCRNFNGKFFLSPTHFFEGNMARSLVSCKCPNVGVVGVLDKHCRRLPDCKNNGFRAATGSRKCICNRPFFGDTCEKLCDQGQPMKDTSGRDYCSCIPFYQGEECKQIVCLHGGREEGGRCMCPPQFLGYHCEIDTNKTGSTGITGTRFQRFGDQGGEMFTRDISGTIFSLIMIVVLVVSMYLLMKHRMQVQTRYLHRRPDLLGACNFPVSTGNPTCLSRRDGRPPHDDPRVYPFRPITFPTTMDGGPPPYVPPGQRVRRSRNEVLPPLPSYEDATKMAPMRHNANAISEDSEVVLDGQLTPIQNNQLSRQESVSSNDSFSGTSTCSHHGGGRPCSIEYDSENHAVIHQGQPEDSAASTTETHAAAPHTDA